MRQNASTPTAGHGQQRLATVVVTALTLLAGVAYPTTNAVEPVIDDDDRRIYAVEGDWALYRELVEDAITQQGMVINTVGHIASMLDRTAADVGGESIYRHGESLEFCSARYSRDMMAADPHAIVYCPYVISVYELESEPGTVYVGYQKLPTFEGEARSESLEQVNDLIERVVQGAVSF